MCVYILLCLHLKSFKLMSNIPFQAISFQAISSNCVVQCFSDEVFDMQVESVWSLLDKGNMKCIALMLALCNPFMPTLQTLVICSIAAGAAQHKPREETTAGTIGSHAMRMSQMSLGFFQ